ncbi:MAG TPA: anthranilate synthase component I [Stellaceae bacterium]|nr:anthranilate synthase component I [Stellaceae bacterium]
MTVQPDFAGFADAYGAGQPALVWTSLVADLETPVSAMLKLARGQRMSCLFESVEGGAVRGRYSAIGFRPDVIWRCRRDRAEINREALARPDAFEPEAVPPLESLRALVAESRIDIPAPLPPMSSGLFGYLGYGMIGQIERLPDANPDRLGVPDALLFRPTIVAIFDNLLDRLTIVTPVWPEAALDARAAYDAAQRRLAAVVRDFERGLPPAPEPPPSLPAPTPTSNMTRDAYHRMVERAKEYIAAGDIFQVVPGQRMTLPFTLPGLAFYRSLRRLNPSPFLFFLDFGEFSVIGSSPEILVRLRDGKVTIRPIAGTRARGADEAADRALADELLHDPKELAEHLMLVDLARNDVGRVAAIGTVRVAEMMAIERYSHVMHICSTVEGELAADRDALDALMAGFPAGTVSGAPKVRAMEIIDELEPERRNVYGGAIGYFGGSGAMDTCIALRTAVLKDGTLVLQAGGGVVADSDPEAEYQESLNKLKALLKAAEEAVRFASGG